MAGLSALNFGSTGTGGGLGALLSGLVGTSSNPALQPQGSNGIDLSAFQNLLGNNSQPTQNPSLPANLNFNQQGNLNSNFNPNFAQMGQQMMPNYGNNAVFAANDPGFDGTIYPPEQAFAFMDQFFAQQYPPIWQSSQMAMNTGMNNMQGNMQTGMQQGNWNTGMMVNNTPVNNQFGYNQFGNTGFQSNNFGYNQGFNPNAMYAGYNQGFDPNAMYANYNQGYDPNAMYANYNQGYDPNAMVGYGQAGYGGQDDGSAEMMSMIGALQGMLASLNTSQQQPPVSAIPPGTGGIKPPKPVTTPLPSPVQPTQVAATPPATQPAGGSDADILAMLQSLGLGGATA